MNLSDKNFYYNKLTHFISERIYECIDVGLKANHGYVYWPYPIQILDDSNIVQYNWKMHRATINYRWDVLGFAGANESFEPSIDLHFLLQKGIWSKRAGIDMGTIKNVVAHELHHIAQNSDGSSDPKTESPFQYFMLPHEIEAFHIGFRAQTDYSNIPLIDLMEDYLRLRIECEELTIDEVKIVMDAWLNPEWSLVNVS
jgi:hypothetical protein